MTLISQTIQLDQSKRYVNTILLSQGEKDARTLAFALLNNGVAINLADCAVTFCATKPSGALIGNACTITNAADGKCSYIVTEQTAIESGLLTDVRIRIVKTGETLYTFAFPIEVKPTPDYTTAVESTSEFTDLEIALALAQSLDASAIHKAGDETKAGVLTLSSSPVMPTPAEGDNTTKGATTGFITTAIATLSALCVKLAGNQTIAGIKTFSASPIVPTPTTGTQAANKDYADGSTNTFIPALAFGGNSVGMTYGTRAGSYVKVGKVVFCELNITLTAKGSSVGAAVISNLPFAVDSASSCPMGEMYMIGMPTAGVTFFGVLTGSTIVLRANRSAAAQIDVDNTHFADTSRIRLSFCYKTA